MALVQSEVRVAGTGKVWINPDATAADLPDDLTDPLLDPWAELGYVTTDGVTFTLSRETTDLNAWQGDKIRVLTTAEPMTVEFALMQSNPDVLAAAIGGGTFVTATGVTTFTPPPKGTNTERALCIDFTDGDPAAGGVTYRYVIPRAQIDADVAFQLQRADSLNYPLTFGVLDNDPKYTIITDDPAFVTGALARTNGSESQDAPQPEMADA